jgi:hypothetical protein
MKGRSSISALASIALLAACAPQPLRYGEVVTIKPGEHVDGDYPAPGTVWRLDEAELQKLSPAPYQEPPPPPRRPPPPPRTYYPPPPPPWYYY